MIYLALGEAIRQGVPLYSGAHDNKPPLLYILAAISGSLFWFKAILCLWHLVTVYLFWKLTDVLFPKNVRLQKVATITFALLTTLPLLEGNIANAEIFMVGPTLAAFIILLTKKSNFRNIFLAGVLFSFASLFKIPAAFEVPVIIFYWLTQVKKFELSSIRRIIIKSFYLFLGFAIPIALTFVWYYFTGAFKEYLIAAYLQNVGYLSSFRPGDVQEPFLTKNAPLLFRGAILAFSLLIIFIKRKVLSKEFVFIVAWLLFTLFAVTLSERPYPHYFIQSAPAIGLLLGMLFSLKRIEQVYVIIPLTLTFIIPVYFKFWYYPTASYYLRFVKFATNQISTDEYIKTFGDHIPRNYKVAEFVRKNSRPEDKIFVWGDSSIVYALARRLPPIKYVADYHISDFSSKEIVAEDLQKNPPVLVIILPNSQAFPELALLLNLNYGLVETIDRAEIWQFLSPSLQDLQQDI